MKTITIRLIEDNAQVEFHRTKADAEAHADKHDGALITSEEDLQEAFTGPQLVKVYNSIVAELGDLGATTDLGATKRFASASAGSKRVVKALEELKEARKAPQPITEEPPAPASDPAPAAKPKKAKAAQPLKRRGRGVNLSPKGWLKPCREGSKQQKLLDMLSRPEGATMEQLREALSGGNKPWSDATIKSGLNWDMNAVKGYGIRTEFKEDGTQVYHIVLPRGMSKPLPPTELKTKKPEEVNG